MKRLSTTPITPSAGYRVKKGSFEFIQDAYKELSAATIIALIGSGYSTSVVYVLYGCINSGTYPVYNITAGAVFYNGEIYYVDAANFTSIGTDVALFSVITTQFTTNADPVTLTDLTVVNIHNIRKMLINSGVAGSTIANFSQAVIMNFIIPAQVNITASGQAAVSGAYPNININVPAASNLNPVLSSGTYNVGDISGSVYNEFTVTFGTVLATSNYIVLGSVVSNGTPVNDCVAVWTVRNRTTSAFTLCLRELVSPTVVQNIAFDYIIHAK